MNSFYFDALSIQNGRETNMDSIMIKERELSDRAVCLAVICDGVGSRADGAFASVNAVRMLGKWFDSITDLSRIGLRMRDELLKIDREISVNAGNMRLRTGTTASVLLLDGENYYIAHVGDSRIYVLGNGELEQLTYDQVNNGRLTSCLGGGISPTIFYNEGRCTNRRFLLCSDGLYKKTGDGILRSELENTDRRTCKKTIQRLTQYAVDHGERDNISLAVVICES